MDAPKAASGRAPVGRRDRNMRDKRDRIFQAAEELFEERGFEAVTTFGISERADVATGTLFRYAASKTELLMMIYNGKVREALRKGADRGARAGNAADAALAMVSPLVEQARKNAENTAVYQRELLFGPTDEPNRMEGLALIAGLETALASRLSKEAATRGLSPEADAARLAASSIFAVTHLVIARATTGTHSGRSAIADLAGQIGQIIDGYLACQSKHAASASGARKRGEAK